MTPTTSQSLDQMLTYFETLHDPRSSINRRHPLPSVIVIAIIAILAGATGPTAIARWTKLKANVLHPSLPLPNGIPSKDVFRTVLSRLDPCLFQASLAQWLASLSLAAHDRIEDDRVLLNVDGKTLRRSHDHAGDLKALHSVSVWASERGLTMAQVACDEKSNEITAIPEVLRLVDLNGAIITIDAMGTQKEIAQQIHDGKADYVLALKENHPKLFHAVVNYMEEQLDTNTETVVAHQVMTTETGHGRTDTRIDTLLPVPKDLEGRKEWAGLQSLGMVMRHTVEKGTERVEVRYDLSSLKAGVELFARTVRGHWGIENGCHWTLDMTFREDESWIRGDKIRESVAWLNRMALSQLKQHPSEESIAMKRRGCGWDDNFLLQVLTGTKT